MNIKSKLLLVDEFESLYIFRKNNLKPIQIFQDKNIEYDFEFIISSFNENLNIYLEYLNNKDFYKFLEIRNILSKEDISNDLNKVRDVTSTFIKSIDNSKKRFLNLIKADNIINNSYELTLYDDINIVKDSTKFRPFFQNTESCRGLFENASLLKPFLEKSFSYFLDKDDIELDYFSFYKYNEQLYVNFIDKEHKQYFIKDNLLYTLAKKYSKFMEDDNKLEYHPTSTGFDNMMSFDDYSKVSNQILKAIKDLQEFIKNDSDIYASSQTSSIIFNAAVNTLLCVHNPVSAPALVVLPLAEELVIATLNEGCKNFFKMDDDLANFVSKASYLFAKAGCKNFQIDILDSLLDRLGTDEKFYNLVDSLEIDRDAKKVIKEIYDEFRNPSIDDLNIFELNNKAEKIKEKLITNELILKSVVDVFKDFSNDVVLDNVSNHRTFISNDKIEQKKEEKDDGFEV